MFVYLNYEYKEPSLLLFYEKSHFLLIMLEDNTVKSIDKQKFEKTSIKLVLGFCFFSYVVKKK